MKIEKAHGKEYRAQCLLGEIEAFPPAPDT